ncbi:hypothetical protein Enr8_08820 [Blastopirellula retiformator]|uniref:Uncharacterized protein n=1 Tax=Blastopirellula retiformator TaxID=2527970 RepID=A0A5C5VKR4_9BACT|nr:hypothetical protein Enr8_08820 [Blastopirellula retiformator]
MKRYVRTRQEISLYRQACILAAFYKICCDHCDIDPKVEEWFDEDQGCWIRHGRGISTKGYGCYDPCDEEVREWFARPNCYSTLRIWVDENRRPSSTKGWRYRVFLCRQCGAVNALPCSAFRNVTVLFFATLPFVIAAWLESNSFGLALLTFSSIFYPCLGLGALFHSWLVWFKWQPCAACSSHKFITFPWAKWRKNRCPNCGEQSLRVTVRHVILNGSSHAQ